ncbi:hypothetical protein KIL84_004518 [Mauremys mutica]|uniref:Uncharacterized protein n=1 Tax=Mauremys mutica TaxID=74926 RepID=A0A9D3XNA7_9SAUR|nr:hypothetical protein KIL84_004518 [Mauremys mutica]
MWERRHLALERGTIPMKTNGKGTSMHWGSALASLSFPRHNSGAKRKPESKTWAVRGRTRNQEGKLEPSDFGEKQEEAGKVHAEQRGELPFLWDEAAQGGFLVTGTDPHCSRPHSKRGMLT